MSTRRNLVSRCAALPFLVLLFLALLACPARAAEPTTQLKLGAGSPWRFSGESWSEDGNGVITPPNHRNLQSRAFSIGQAYGDFTAEFEYNPNYREVGTGGAGLILRAQDPNHFYAVYLPWGGQALHTKNYWAMIVKVSGDGYLRALKTAWVPGVTSETDRWYKVKVVAKGPTIDVWVDGRKAVSATDDSYASGAVGLIGYGWYFFRDVKITGKTGAISPWPAKSDIPTHSFEVGLNSQQSQSACVAPNGDVLLASGSLMLRSKDKGHTWSAPETLPDFLGTVADLGSCMFRAKDGRLLVHVVRGNHPPEFLMSESTDNGLTWSQPAAAAVESGWREDLKFHAAGAMVQTDDGTMVRFLYGGLLNGRDTGNIATWGNWSKYKAVAIRSTDGGKSWSKPIEIDRPTWTGKTRGEFEGAFDFTEVGGVAIGNKVTALIRPVYSPTMWQCWSDDAGANWDAAVRTTFPGYGGPWVIRTQNGTLVCGHRIPHFALNLSSDGGLNWDEGTVIDFPAWANGTVTEVEPNVLLCAYMNYDQPKPLLVQLVRVHPDRVEPIQP